MEYAKLMSDKYPRFLLEYRTEGGDTYIKSLDNFGVFTDWTALGVCKSAEDALNLAREHGWVTPDGDDGWFSGEACKLRDVKAAPLVVGVVGGKWSDGEMFDLVRNSGIPLLEIVDQWVSEDGMNHVSVELEVPLNWTWESIATV